MKQKKTPCEVVAPRVLVRCDKCKHAQPNRKATADVQKLGFDHVAVGCLFCGHLYGAYA